MRKTNVFPIVEVRFYKKSKNSKQQTVKYRTSNDILVANKTNYIENTIYETNIYKFWEKNQSD